MLIPKAEKAAVWMCVGEAKAYQTFIFKPGGEVARWDRLCIHRADVLESKPLRHRCCQFKGVRPLTWVNVCVSDSTYADTAARDVSPATMVWRVRCDRPFLECQDKLGSIRSAHVLSAKCSKSRRDANARPTAKNKIGTVDRHSEKSAGWTNAK